MTMITKDTIRNLLILTLFTLLVANSGIVNGSENPPFPLVLEEGSLALIVLPYDAVPAEKTAAKELSEHLHRMTGAEFPVYSEADAADIEGSRILVGPSAEARALFDEDELDTLAVDAFRIRTSDHAIALVGQRPRGSLYAVYSFLENDLGVRWLDWFGEVYLPSYRDIRISPIDRYEEPAFPVRDIIVRTNRFTAWDDLRDFLVRNKCQGPELTLLENIEDYGGASHRYVTHPDRPNYLMIHTLHRFMRPADYFEENPEFFSYDKSRDRWVPRQLNFSNPEMKETLTGLILKAIENDRGEGLISVTAMDVGGELSEDEESMRIVREEGTSGAPLLKYIAEDLAPAVARKYPDVTITTLAYRQSRKAPATIRFPDNVLIVWAPIGSDFARPLTHPNNAEALAEFKEWAAISPTMWIWYYPEPYREPLAMGNFHRYAEDFRLFREYGVEGLFLQTGGPGQFDQRRLASLSHWLMTKLMWNPDLDVDALIADFVGHYYGPAAPMMMEYVMELEAATADAGFMGWDTNLDSFRFMDADRLKRWQELFDRAMEATAHAPQFAARTAYARMSLDHATLRTWTLQGLDGVLPVSRDVVVDRYIDTYERANRYRRIDPQRKDRAEISYNLTMDQLRSFAGLKPFKPLPPPLNEIAPERVHQLSPDGVFTKNWNLLDLVEDPDAAGDIAVRFDNAAGEKLRLAYYERTEPDRTVTEHGIDLNTNEIIDAQYQMYHIGRSRLSDMGYVYTKEWRIQFHDTKYVFDPENPDKTYDIYISMKVTPSEDDAVESDAPIRVWIDRVVLVEIEDA